MNFVKYLKKSIVLTVLFFLVNVLSVAASENTEDKNNVIKNNSNSQMKIAITFDDGPHPRETDKILDILEKYDAKATFFVVGKHVNWYTSSVIRASKLGHEIGNHTYNHPDISTLSDEEIKTEIKLCEDIIFEKTGQRPKLFRPPFGNYSEKSLSKISENLGYTVVLWSGVDVKDWKNPSPCKIAAGITGSVKPGDIVLLHDYGTDNTVEALDEILSSLTKRGYKFVTVSELLNDKNKKNSN